MLCAVKAESLKSWRNKDILSSIHEAHVSELLSRHLGPLPSRKTHGGPSTEEQTRSFSEDRSRCRERLHIAAYALIIGSENETEKNQEPHVCCSETLLHYISALEARWSAPLRGWFEPRGMTEGEVWCTSKHLLFNDVGGLIVEDGLQAVGVSWCLWVQGEGQGHVNGGKFIPEFFLILH